MPSIEVWTDGSGPPPVKQGEKCVGPGGWAAVLKLPNNPFTEIRSGGERDTTVSRMELTALLKILEFYTTPQEFIIHTDSAYLLDAFEKGWIRKWKKNGWIGSRGKAIANRDLWERLDAASEPHKLHFIKVKGHDPEGRFKLNDLADAEARAARDRLATGVTGYHFSEAELARV